MRYLKKLYPRAKLIVADGLMFLGSQNLSETSLTRNREVGVAGGSPVGEAVR